MRHPVLFVALGVLFVLGAFPVRPAAARSADTLSSSAAQSRPTLRLNSTGAAVKELQQRLNAWLPAAPQSCRRRLAA